MEDAQPRRHGPDGHSLNPATPFKKNIPGRPSAEMLPSEAASCPGTAARRKLDLPMPRVFHQESEPVNADSFLDIVASVVCIMLIMVVMVGMRIRNTPIDPLQAVPGAAEAHGALETALAEERSLRAEIAKILEATQRLEEATAARALHRDMLATGVAALERELSQRRSALDAQTQARFDATNQLAEARRRLDDLREQRRRVETARPEAIVVESYPTPLGRTVDDEELHFHLRQGRVAFVPIEKLVRLARDDARRKADQLIERDGLPEFTEAVGPEGGFRFRYTVQRHDTIEEQPSGAVIRHIGLRITEWTVIPVGGQVGETVEEALAPDSAFRRALAQRKSDKTTITIWVYADSFDAFRRLRKELHQLGLGVAARPLPDGVLIAGSPRGSKSEAQ